MKKITQERIRQIVADAIADGTTAGVSILVRKNGEELFYDEQGYANIEGKKPIQRDTIFRLYSMTKIMTSISAMILMEQGKLDLVQPVAELLPGYDKLRVENNGAIMEAQMPMRVLDLLNMTSGFTYGDEKTIGGRQTLAYIEECEKRMFTENAVTTQEFAEHLGSIPLAFEPDSSWCYSLSADVLGAVIEKAGGMRLGDFMKNYIFHPLGMKDTDFWVPEEKQSRLAASYESLGNGEILPYEGNHLIIDNRMRERPSFESGGAGLVSTIDDYARLAQMLLNDGQLDGVRIMAPQTARFLRSGDLSDRQKLAQRNWEGLTGFTYSHLMRRCLDPGQASGLARKDEYGWDGWLGCYFANFPNEQVTLLLMQQRKDSGVIPLTRKIRNVLLSDDTLFDSDPAKRGSS